MNTLKIKKGDTVQVMLGKDKGKKGTVMKVLPLKSMVLVENVNQYKRHIKSRMQGQKSEIVTITKPLHVSKVSLIDPKKKKPTRAGYKIVKGNKILQISQNKYKNNKNNKNMYKFKIIKSDSGYRAQFLYNSEIIWWTETYTSKASAENAIRSILENGSEAEIVGE